MLYPSRVLQLLLVGFLFVTSSCKQNNSGKIDAENVDLKLIRFEEELFKQNIYTLADSFFILKQQHPEFLSLFGNRIIEIGDPSEPFFGEALGSFVTDQAIWEINQRVQAVFQNLNPQINTLKQGFGRFQSLFPEKSLPAVYTYISGFNQSIVVTEHILGISLEKYLGTNEKLYDQVYPPLPAYQRALMNPDRIAIDAMLGWIVSEFDYAPEQDNLLSRIIHEGRNMYLLSMIYPELTDSVLWGYSQKKMAFCYENESTMWTYMIEQKLLFNTDNFRILQFTGEAPFTKDFSQDSPGKAAIWVGYKIIDSYIKKNSSLSLLDLMKETNYQKILNDSRYKP